MPATVLIPPASRPVATSLTSKLLNVLASPGEVFDEVLVAPPNPSYILVPTFMACLSGLVLLEVVTTQEQIAAAVSQLVQSANLSTAQQEVLSTHWHATSRFAVCFTILAGTLSSSSILWLIGRVFLKSRFAFTKTLELVGLTQMTVALSSVMTALLVCATGDHNAHPALSLLLPTATHSHAEILDAFNLFHFWTAALLALALSKLSRVSFKEAAFWVVGWWLLVRIGLLLLG
jgi:hypothetical protein